ncbi:MAG: hypothetical protein K2P74_08380, partial [Nitrosomonas sp.]|nr:hypothetical protein [Nitrosomonas sp.]
LNCTVSHCTLFILLILSQLVPKGWGINYSDLKASHHSLRCKTPYIDIARAKGHISYRSN